MISALESALGTDFELSEAEGFLQTSHYYHHAAGPTGYFFNYSDCTVSRNFSAAMYWFAARRKKPFLLWGEQQKLVLFLASLPDPTQISDRTLPFLLVWAGAIDTTPVPGARHWKGDGRTPVAFHRSGWETEDEIFVGVKGGSPGSSHAHMDIGSFVMDAHGVRWATDLGSQGYNSLESKGIRLWDRKQDGQRWDIFRLNNFSHNTLVVDGKKQRVSGNAPIVGFSDKGAMPHTIVDLGSVYEGQLAAAKRGIGLHRNRSVVIRDELQTLYHPTSVRWGMVTHARVRFEYERQAVLQQAGKQLSLRVLSPADARLQLFETAKPPHDYDAPNPGTRMIGFQVDIPSSTSTSLVVQLCPGNATADEVVEQKLADW
jgi:hypothetical protein